MKFDLAEEELRIYLNLDRRSKLINRAHKLLRHPIKYTAEQLYKIGILKNPDRLIRTCFGSEMKVPLWDANAVVLYYTGTLALQELLITRFLARTLDGDSVFYDVGANLGYFSALAARYTRAVHAFEPNPSIIPYLADSIRRSGLSPDALNEVALSDAEGGVTFYDTSLSRLSGSSSLVAEHVSHLETRKIMVPSQTLDTYTATHAPPTIIKIDVEGAEHLVWAGAAETLSNYGPDIIMEVLSTPKHQKNAMKAVEMLETHGYRPYVIDREGNLERTDISFERDENLVFKKGPY